MKTCKYCNSQLTEVQIERGNDFCSRQCANKSRTLEKGNCPVCGKKLDRPEQKYCSRKCYGKALTKDNVKRNNKGQILYECKCVVCGEKFKSTYQHTKTCSDKCLFKLREINSSGKNNPNYKGPVTKKCAYCGKEFSYPRAEAPKKYCSKHCQIWGSARNRRKENHWRFKGDPKRDRGPNWNEQKTKARRRDNYQCQNCGVHESELNELLSVHHIKPYREFDDWKEANKLDNLISLCRSCHAKIELANEKQS